MHATQSLPEGYVLRRSLDLSKDHRLLLILNLAAVGLLIVFYGLFSRLAISLRPGSTTLSEGGFISTVNLSSLLSLVVAIVVTLILHELVHALFFWMITRSRPVFGLRTAYAYAAAPGWYIPRLPYTMVGLAPLVVITLIGVLWMPLVPSELLPALIFALTMNAAGAVGDLWIVTWLQLQKAGVLVRDRGDAVEFYVLERPNLGNNG